MRRSATFGVLAVLLAATLTIAQQSPPTLSDLSLELRVDRQDWVDGEIHPLRARLTVTGTAMSFGDVSLDASVMGRADANRLEAHLGRVRLVSEGWSRGDVSDLRGHGTPTIDPVILDELRLALSDLVPVMAGEPLRAGLRWRAQRVLSWRQVAQGEGLRVALDGRFRVERIATGVASLAWTTHWRIERGHPVPSLPEMTCEGSAVRPGRARVDVARGQLLEARTTGRLRLTCRDGDRQPRTTDVELVRSLGQPDLNDGVGLGGPR